MTVQRATEVRGWSGGGVLGLSLIHISMDNALIDLYRHSLVDAQTAIDAAHDVDYVTKNTGRF